MAKYKVKTKECQLIVKVKLSFKEKLNERQLEFFSSKYIRGLLKAKLVKKGIIEYFGPIGISLYDRLKKPITKYDFLFIMEQIVDIVQKLNANALIINNVIFDIKNVYINEITKEIQFIYLPLEASQNEVNIIEFMENIIYSSNPIKEHQSDYISRFVYFIKGLQTFDVEKIEKYILMEDRSVVNIIKRHSVGQSGYMTDKPVDYYAHYEEKDPEATGILSDDQATGKLQEDEVTGLLVNDEETGLLLEDEATGLLNESNKQFQYATLYRGLTEEWISINKSVFRFGKEKSYSDYFVSNNDKVSRSHADIITRGQRFYITDLNSKNRTYVNEKVIPAQQEIEIFHGDKLRLANEEFEFRI
jgi:hypothetical protein